MSESRKLIVRTKRVGNYEIVYDGGGETPGALRGDWNRIAFAQRAITAYEANQAALEQVKSEKRYLEEVVAAKRKEDLKKKADQAAKRRAEKKKEKVDGKGPVGV